MNHYNNSYVGRYSETEPGNERFTLDDVFSKGFGRWISPEGQLTYPSDVLCSGVDSGSSVTFDSDKMIR